MLTPDFHLGCGDKDYTQDIPADRRVGMYSSLKLAGPISTILN